ncbi:MAG TPA: beta-ketoacyl synthase N-terminal-like domain-containing protein [Cyclobacteriaceae bacterium]|nr:beta-ketoacyl synthase N-terminal-like domain-containing protein [Cyclobacteriaceae bacterium]
MKHIAILSDSLISPLGKTSTENFDALRDGRTGVSRIEDPLFAEESFLASKIDALPLYELGVSTRFEALVILSIEEALAKANNRIPLSKAVLILATTKGNIELLDGQPFSPDLDLHLTASKIAARFGIAGSYVVSNACTSGVMALITAKRLLNAGKFNHAIVVGADVLSRFVVSGFKSLHALSDAHCRPFDAQRKGLNLGEAAAAAILSRSEDSEFFLLGDGSSNDANHISGPSRTGEELAHAIALAIKDSAIDKEEIDFISAHGTATPYNDEMEAKAFAKAGLSSNPVNSLKGYFGHTLGAAGLVEVVMGIRSLKYDELISTKGFSALGVSEPLNVITRNESRRLKMFLKTASGFGGCNAAVVIQKK